MALWLNKLVFAVLLFLSVFAVAQEQRSSDKDYKEQDQYERYLRRRRVVAAWQINQLKKSGALVVRLQNKQLAIQALLNAGKTAEAEQLAAYSFIVNKSTMFAYLENFRFCKVYFIFSQRSDSLQNGARKGIFLDTNLVENNNIEMTENFYLLAERDFAYNSSIGFVTEPEAKQIRENGNAIKQMAIVLKNKYGHQLKNPFPHQIKEGSNNTRYAFRYSVQTTSSGNYQFTAAVVRDSPDVLEKSTIIRASKKSGARQIVEIPKSLLYFKLAEYVSQLDSDLLQFYKQTPTPDFDKIAEDIKPFLY